MSKQEKRVEAITARDVDFAQWYTDVVRKAELIDYSSVRGCMILRPYGYAIWEGIMRDLDARFKELGHENVAMPMFIPESLLQREKDHVAGFAPEVAWVTHGGNDKLEERLCIRPTSEVLFCEHYEHIIQSWRDLPKLYNQWVSVVRWEKTTRPFLRSSEFYWQEGHTAHATADEAIAETLQMADVYRDFYRDVLAIPVISGRKSEKEKFAGAVATYTVEAMMHDGKALQSATSHYFGDGFAKAFDISYSDKDNKQQYVHQTSWGLSTRSIGAIIMVHGDDDGLVLPPRIAPTQVMIIPVAQHKPGVLEACETLLKQLKLHFRVGIDASDKMPGWKFSEYEMKGVPLRIEVGPRDLEKGEAVMVRRDNRAKQNVPIAELQEYIAIELDKIHEAMLEKAKIAMKTRIREASNFAEFSQIIENEKGFIKAAWCGEEACELEVKAKTTATTRCILPEEVLATAACVCCCKPAKHNVIWGKSY